MPRKGGGRWQGLLVDRDVKRWYDNLARGSRGTADNYLRVLGRFAAAHDLTPSSFVKLKPKKREDLLADYITGMLDNDKAPSYVEVAKKAVGSWLDWNGVALTRKIRVPGTSRRPSLRESHIPSQEELRRVMNVADARSRTAIALVAFGGVRPEVLGTYLGDDGLRLRDFDEARLVKGELEIPSMPTRILVPERLSKTGRPYFTFLGPEGAGYLAAYLRERMEGGEKLTPDGPVITPRKVDKDFMRTVNIGDLIRKPMRAGGLKEAPYIWRSYFASRAMLAEGKGLTRDYRLFLMGHKGDIQHVYGLHKKLPPDAVETIRRGYKAALEFLETTRDRSRDEDLKSAFRRQILLIAGASEPEVDRMDLDGMSDADLQRIVRERLVGAYPSTGNGPSNGGRQKVVPLTAVETYLEQGWQWVASLPDERAVVRLSG